MGGWPGSRSPDHGIDAEHPLVIDLDATLVTAHSDKESGGPDVQAWLRVSPVVRLRRSRRRPAPGEPLAILLRPGNAGSNTAADHMAVLADALAQLPWQPGYRVGRKVLVRADGAGGTHEFLNYLARPTPVVLGRVHPVRRRRRSPGPDPRGGWTPAYDADGQVRDGAWVAEVTGLLDLSGWPPGMRVIVRKERPHPGAQLRFTDRDGLRLTAFATNTTRGQLPDLELRHRRRARCEDRIRNAKDTGLANLPLHGFAQNRILARIRAGES